MTQMRLDPHQPRRANMDSIPGTLRSPRSWSDGGKVFTAVAAIIGLNFVLSVSDSEKSAPPRHSSRTIAKWRYSPGANSHQLAVPGRIVSTGTERHPYAHLAHSTQQPKRRCPTAKYPDLPRGLMRQRGVMEPVRAMGAKVHRRAWRSCRSIRPDEETSKTK